MKLVNINGYSNSNGFSKIELCIAKEATWHYFIYMRDHILLDNKFMGFVPKVLPSSRAKRYLNPIKEEVLGALTSLLFHEEQLVRELAKNMQQWLEP